MTDSPGATSAQRAGIYFTTDLAEFAELDPTTRSRYRCLRQAPREPRARRGVPGRRTRRPHRRPRGRCPPRLEPRRGLQRAGTRMQRRAARFAPVLGTRHVCFILGTALCSARLPSIPATPMCGTSAVSPLRPLGTISLGPTRPAGHRGNHEQRAGGVRDEDGMHPKESPRRSARRCRGRWLPGRRRVGQGLTRPLGLRRCLHRQRRARWLLAGRMPRSG